MLLYFTSGTTAKPKLVLHSQRSYPVGGLSTMYWLGLQPGDVHLNISSPGWAKHAWSCFFAPWNAGATVFVVNQPRFDARGLLATIGRCGVTTLCAPPRCGGYSFRRSSRASRYPCARSVAPASRSIPEVIDQVRAAWGLTIRDGYGQTETTALAGNSPGQKVKVGSMGRPLPGYRVQVTDADGHIDKRRRGHALLLGADRPAGLMQGYQGDDGRLSGADGELYRSGDVVFADEEGYLTFVGRSDDVFKSSDYRISPFELESILLEHESVAEAAVVPSPDPIRLAIPRRTCCWCPARSARRKSHCRFSGICTAGWRLQAIRRISELPGVERVAVGTLVPWREAGAFFAAQFTVEGYAKADGEEDPRGRFRTVSPGFFAALGVPIVAGRDFNAADTSDSEKVVIVSQSLAQRLFPNQDAVNRRLLWTDPVMKFIDVSTGPRRIVGVAADVDDENIVPGAAMVVYHPMDQEIGGGRLFVYARTDPYALVPPITRIIRGLSADQPVEQAATLDDVRAEVLAPNRLNAMVFSGFAGVALTIAVVGVAGVLAFSVSARTREFGVRLAVGSTPRHLLGRILGEGAVIASAGIAAGVVGGIALARVVGVFVQDVAIPGILPLAGAAAILVAAAVLASLMPAARASRVDVMQALRSE